MTYKESLDFLFSSLPAYHRIGKAAYKADLDNIKALDEYFGHPHSKFKSIHIAGTNGKGSVSHMVASILQEYGYRTGLYTSPHLKDFRERIKINGRMIPEREVTSFIDKHSGKIGLLKPSFFEMTVAMAFDYFAREKVDIAVIEVGLGGRLDSTNIIEPVVSVITNIGHDHMDLLGDTLAKVAAEKAGIIKNKVPAVIGETQPDIKDLFITKAAESCSPVYFADDRFSCTLGDWNSLSGMRDYSVKDLTHHRLFSGLTPLGGIYQQKNIQTVFQVIEVLKPEFMISDATGGIKNVIKNTGLLGRWQPLGKDPLIICDTGHNKEGLEYVLHQISMIRADEVHFIIGFVNDKDLDLVLPLFPRDAKYYFTRASIARALDEKKLQAAAFEYGLEGECFPGVKQALEAARSTAARTDIIFIGGSTFIVAEII